jgi:hypothetical protein
VGIVLSSAGEMHEIAPPAPFGELARWSDAQRRWLHDANDFTACRPRFEIDVGLENVSRGCTGDEDGAPLVSARHVGDPLSTRGDGRDRQTKAYGATSLLHGDSRQAPQGKGCAGCPRRK